MTDEKHSPGGGALTQLVLEIFRVNGRLLSAGDRIVADIGLTSARWQVLGAIHFAEEPRTVSWLARSMGLTRQAIQRVANELEKEGLVEFRENPAHRRAQIVTLTRKGRSIYAAAERRQIPWINALAKGFSRIEIEQAVEMLRHIRRRIESSSGDSLS